MHPCKRGPAGSGPWLDATNVHDVMSEEGRPTKLDKIKNLQAAGEDARRGQDHQALQPAGHALRRLMQDDKITVRTKQELSE